MMTRRRYLKLTLAAGAATLLKPSLSWAKDSPQLITRAIPASGERVPVVGLGSSATFAQVARGEDVAVLREVFQAPAAQGGRVTGSAWWRISPGCS